MRIRSIKPEFWRSKDVAALKKWDDRLLFIGLWSYVDDNGVGVDDPVLIAADLFTRDLAANSSETVARVSEGLQTLFSAKLITRYEIDGSQYIHITTWSKHQRIDKPNKPRFPTPTCGNANIFARQSRDGREGPALGIEEQGNRGSSSIAHPPSEQSRFEEFYAIYPRKVGKQKAKERYDRARKRADQETIIAGARKLAADPHLPEKTFIPHPQTWLERDGWLDEPLPPRGTVPKQPSPANEHDARIKAWRQRNGNPPVPQELFSDPGKANAWQQAFLAAIGTGATRQQAVRTADQQIGLTDPDCGV